MTHVPLGRKGTISNRDLRFAASPGFIDGRLATE
jgi:hypothetical protein